MNGSLGECSPLPATDPPPSQDEFTEGEQSAKLWDCIDLPWAPTSGALKSGAPSMDHQASIFSERGHLSFNAPPHLGGLASPHATNGKASKRRAAAPRGLSSAPLAFR